MNRRNFFAGSLSGFFAFAMRNRAQHVFAHQPTGRAKRCIVLWMNGGPSQLDTFDPKPGTTTGGEFGQISTAAPGVSICETLPRVARQLDKLSVVRCLTSTEGDHVRAQYYLHTGYRFVPGFPRPAAGAIVSRQSAPTEFPRFVTIGSRGYGPAYVGPDHAPFAIENPAEALQLLRRTRQRRNRIRLLQDLGESFDGQHAATMLDRRRSMISRVETLVSTSFVEAFDLQRESSGTRSKYGEHAFGQGCLLARRLLEVGVNFVEVQHDGWDTHADNFTAVRRLCGEIDRPWSALMDELQAVGLLDETIVLWMGEFGRTPNINPNQGRDHFPRVTPAVIGGGGIAGGRVIGTTNRLGTQIEGNAYQVADLFATLFQSLGIDPAHEFETSFGSPATATDNGTPIQALM